MVVYAVGKRSGVGSKLRGGKEKGGKITVEMSPLFVAEAC